MHTVPDPEAQIRAMYSALLAAWGKQHWWPAQSRFEVIAGAFLTQNTSWRNVELALANLRRERVLNLAGMRALPLPELERLVRPAGYFRQKAARLKAFVSFVDQRYAGSLDRMFARRTTELRAELLTLSGVGPETADSILLYAGNHEVFVVDAYARRIFERHGIASSNASYDELQALVEQALAETYGETPKTVANGRDEAQAPFAAHAPSRMSRARRSSRAQRFNEMHGLLVRAAKAHCGKQQPDCESCPARDLLPLA